MLNVESLHVVENEIIVIFKFGNNRWNNFRKKKDWDGVEQVMIVIIMVFEYMHSTSHYEKANVLFYS